MPTDAFSVSVIIPTFNRAQWLKDCLQSVIQQSHQANEIIVVDDGSIDDTKKIVASFPQVQYVSQINQGPSAARNAGALLAQSNWLAFLDSDDRWLPDKLKRQVEFLQDNRDIKAVYTDEIWIRNGVRVNQKKKHRKYSGFIYQHCLPLCIISPSSIVLEKELFSNLGCFDPELPACEDYDLWLRLALQEKIGFIETPLIIKNGGHEDQLSRQWGLDKYRVIALEKMLHHPNLHGDNRRLTQLEAKRRCEILITGFKKHHAMDEVAFYRQKLSDFSAGELSSKQKREPE